MAHGIIRFEAGYAESIGLKDGDMVTIRVRFNIDRVGGNARARRRARRHARRLGFLDSLDVESIVRIVNHL